MSTPPSKVVATLAGSVAEISRVEKNIQSTEALSRQLEAKYRQDAKAFERDIKYQTLKFEIHTAKLRLRKCIIKDHSDSIAMHLGIITRADKRLLKKLQQKARDLGWTFSERQREYMGCIERWGHELELWMEIYTLQEAIVAGP